MFNNLRYLILTLSISFLYSVKAENTPDSLNSRFFLGLGVGASDVSGSKDAIVSLGTSLNVGIDLTPNFSLAIDAQSYGIFVSRNGVSRELNVNPFILNPRYNLSTYPNQKFWFGPATGYSITSLEQTEPSPAFANKLTYVLGAATGYDFRISERSSIGPKATYLYSFKSGGSVSIFGFSFYSLVIDFHRYF